MKKISSDFDEIINNVTDDVLFQCMDAISPQAERIHDALSDENMDHPVVSKFLWESVINGLSVEEIADAMVDCANDAVIMELDGCMSDPSSDWEPVFCFKTFIEKLKSIPKQPQTTKAGKEIACTMTHH
jgi:hypothetical protein